MATSWSWLPAYFNVDADFRTWGSAINAALSTIGLVVTADTGQINWTTVAKPGGANTAQGYEIWKLNDSAQAYGATTYYFKIEYGSGGTTDRPSVWITVGTGSNGSGTLTGQTTSRNQAAAGGSKSAGVQLPSYFSGDGSRFAMMLNADSSSNTFPILLAAERTRGPDGGYTADGLVMMYVSPSTSGAGYSAVPATGTVPTVGTSYLPVIPTSGSQSSNNGSGHPDTTDLPVGTMVYYCSGKPFYGLSAVSVLRSDLDSTVYATITPVVLGRTHTYIALICSSCGFGGISNTIDYLGMLWE